ncbi:8890_t:CDS:1, partial [Funneliformis caledonium]
MASRLPADCIDQVIKYLEEDASSLYSCLLVNWAWCDISVRILWSNPWNFEKTSDYAFWTAITPTILCCLSHDSQEILRRNGVIRSILHRPTYDYVRFCQHLTPEAVDQLTREHVNDNADYYRGYKDYLFEQEIYKLFMSKSSLRHLVLPKAPLSYCPGSTTCLQKLRVLVCGSDLSPEYFFGLAQTCRNVQKLVIDPCHDNDGLATLIEFQTGLKYVELQAPDGQDNEYPRIGRALISQAQSISTLYFHGSLCIRPSSLAEFVNLKYLKLFISGKISNLSQFASTVFPKLEVLDIFWDEHTPFDIFTQFIENTQGTLSRIYWNTDCPPTRPEEIRNYLDLLSRPKFSNLNFVTIWWNELAIEKLSRFLTIHQRLQALKIYTFTNRADGKDLFDLIIRVNSPYYLKVLNLDGEWQFTPEDLAEFLEQWKLSERKPLSFYIPFRFIVTSYFEEIIQKYREEGILK